MVGAVWNIFERPGVGDESLFLMTRNDSESRLDERCQYVNLKLYERLRRLSRALEGATYKCEQMVEMAVRLYQEHL